MAGGETKYSPFAAHVLYLKGTHNRARPASPSLLSDQLCNLNMWGSDPKPAACPNLHTDTNSCYPDFEAQK